MKTISYSFYISFLLFSLISISFQKELFEDYYERAEKILLKMSRNEIIGQIFFPRYTLETVDHEIRTYFPGGFVLFENNIQNHTKEQLINELEERQKISKIPLAYGVDEEGGTVVRVSRVFRDEPFPSPQDLYDEGGIDKIIEIEKEKINLLRELHMHYNLAPVADIALNEEDYMYKRSLAQNVTITTEFITKVSDEYYKNNFTCCLKHYPGYGNNSNTHYDVVHDYRPLEQFKTVDLVPFGASVSHKQPMIMFSHNIVHCIDPEYPSSISKKVHDVLIKDYGYSGLLVTDSLSMGAITKYTKNISAAVLAVESGNDVIITSTFEKHITELIEAVDKKEVSMDLIKKAAKKVIAWKLKYIYPQEEEEEEEEGLSGLNIILIIVLSISTFGLIFLFVFVFYQYRKPEEKKDETFNVGKIRETSSNSDSLVH